MFFPTTFAFGLTGFGFRLPFEIPFTARMPDGGRGITSITRIVPGAAFIKFIKNIHFDRSATPAITITLTIKTETGSSRGS